MARKHESVPAEPFTRWLNNRLGQITAAYRGDVRGAVERLVLELGWDKPSIGAGQRKLYRFRKQIMYGSTNGVKDTRHADWFPRETVEEALFNAGVPFEDVYPEIAAREDVFLEPEDWCPGCQAMVHPIDGLCPWCEWRMGPQTGQELMGKRREAA